MARSWSNSGQKRDQMDPIRTQQQLAARKRITQQQADDDISIVRAVQASKRMDDDVSSDVLGACNRNVRIVTR